MEKVILCVGRNRRNQELLAQVLARAGHGVAIAHSYEALGEALEASISPKNISLVLLDIAGFDRRVWQHCERLRLQTIPLVLIMPPNSTRFLTQYARSLNRVPLLTKPLSIRPLLTLVSNTLQS